MMPAWQPAKRYNPTRTMTRETFFLAVVTLVKHLPRVLPLVNSTLQNLI